MGLHYQLEDTELGLCFDCGLVIESGSAGCAIYTEESLKELAEQGLEQQLLDAFAAAYKIQHYNYLSLQETEAMGLLQQVADYLAHGEASPMDEETQRAHIRANLFQPAQSPVSLVQILAAETNETKEQLIEEYMNDIFDVYGHLE